MNEWVEGLIYFGVFFILGTISGLVGGYFARCSEDQRTRVRKRDER